MKSLPQPLLLTRLADSVRHSRWARSCNAVRLACQALFGGPESRADQLCRALAFSEHRPLSQWISRTLRSHQIGQRPDDTATWRQVVANLPRYRRLVKRNPQLTRSILLKAPGPGGERGVLLMYFEYNWARLALGLSPGEFESLTADYDLVLSTSWSPTDYACLALILSQTQGLIFVQPCNYEEAEKLSDFHPRLRVLNSLPCDWINPGFYESPIAQERPIDILMVANWGAFKRHWEFFRTLASLPSHLRVVLVGQSEGGRDSEFIRKLARRFRVPQQLELFESIPVEQVSKLQSQSKVSVIFTRREGCCVAAVESLFAGCALGMRADAHVGPRHYINEQTGLLLRPGHLAEDLLTLLQRAGSLNPARWARENISCFQTHRNVNEALRAAAEERHLPWSTDLAPAHWRPYPVHVHTADRESLRPAYALLHQRFPSVFPADLADQSWR